MTNNCLSSIIQILKNVDGVYFNVCIAEFEQLFS